MKTVVLCNRSDRLERMLQNTEQPLDFICLLDPLEDHEPCEHLRRMAGASELSATQLARRESGEFRKKYIDFMGRVNMANHSRQWWAMPFTNKYALNTRLCRNLFQFHLITGAHQTSPGTLVVLTGSKELAKQVSSWSRGAGVSVKRAVNSPVGLKGQARRLLPVAVVKQAVLSVLLRIAGRNLRPAKNRTDRRFLVGTHTHSRSFPADGSYMDAYFGPLIGELAESGSKPIVLGLPYEQPFRQVGEIGNLRSAIPVVPADSCLSLGAILACTWQAVKSYWSPPRLREPTKFEGADVSHLVKQAIGESTRSGNFFLSLKVFYAARWLSRRIKVGRGLYPFENRSWEKMLISGVAEGSPDARMVAYQHTSMTPHHANFFMASDEAAITPLPHAIVTCGDVTRDWIKNEGNYPEGMVTSACALRQTLAETPPEIGKDSKSNTTIKNLLVILATGEEEYVLTSQFLSEALEGNDQFQVRLRPHPNLPMLEFPELPGVSVSTGPLPDDLTWADAVLYASSTVSMEAIALGIPAIFLDLGAFLNTDPMYGWNEFKWEVSVPSQLADTIDEIESIPQDRFQNLQQRGLDYVYSYLKPVTPDNMRPFWDA